MNPDQTIKPPDRMFERPGRRALRARWRETTDAPSALPRLVFAPQAWLKLLCFLHAGDTEVGGFGISAPDNPLYVQDFATVTQTVSRASVVFDDVAVADHFERCVDQGLAPAQFARIWCHTHPGSSSHPSDTDEETFYRVFGACDWAVMFILSRTHDTYARLSFGAGPGGHMALDVEVDWQAWPRFVAGGSGAAVGGPAALGDWADEYRRNIHRTPTLEDVQAMELALQAWGAGELERELSAHPGEDRVQVHPLPERLGSATPPPDAAGSPPKWFEAQAGGQTEGQSPQKRVPRCQGLCR